MGTLISVDNTWALWAILTGIAALSIYLEQTYSWASKITGCVIGLVLAMLLSNFKVIPLDAPTYDNVWGYVVPLAIPLLLFKADVRKIWRESGRIMGIFLISSAGTMVGAVVGFIILKDYVPELYKVGAMMAGSYTGGSVNFAAMAETFQAPGELASAAVVADNLLMAVYFFVLIAIPTSNFFLSKFGHPHIDELEKNGRDESKTQAASYWGGKEISLKDIAFAIATAFVIVAVSDKLASIISNAIPDTNFFMALVVGLLGNKYILITTFTMLLATYLPNYMGNIKGSQEIGTFLIYIFFVVIGVPASVPLILQKSPLLLVFCVIMVFFNMVFSFGFGKLFKFNLEEIILASNANIGGPTTAAAMGIAKGWDRLIVPILLVGTLGYVIGNYFGIFMGTFLQTM